MDYLVQMTECVPGGRKFSIPYEASDLPAELRKFIEARPAKVLYESTRAGVPECLLRLADEISRIEGTVSQADNRVPEPGR